MAFRKRRATTTVTKNSVKVPKTYEIDGKCYKSKALMTLHEKLRDDTLVTSFSLPTIQDEKEHRNKKYGAKKCFINELQFDSVMEARFYVYLLHLMKTGEVKSFERQVTYILQDKYRNKFTKKIVPAIKYIADFVMKLADGTEAVIDVKGKETADFKIKKKMFGFRYPDTQFMCVQWSEKEKSWLDLDDINKARREKAKARKTK